MPFFDCFNTSSSSFKVSLNGYFFRFQQRNKTVLRSMIAAYIEYLSTGEA